MKIDQTLKAESKIEERVFTVSEFLDFINEILRPCRAIVQGEIGEKINNYPRFTFFRLLDENNSILECFTWKERIESLGMELEPGMEIRVIGYPEVRRDKGELKFQVERIELIGEGVLKKQFEILKKKLAALDYFDPKFKKPIPRFCENIGLITSKYGKGAKKDFSTHLGKFGFQILFYDVRVEGLLALPEIIEAINQFNQNFPKMDVLVLTRGGGDWESLQPFNSEELVKTIFSSKIPIITGIGHEDDETLADLAADFRTSTPTHAAKILNENWKSASTNIYSLERGLNSSANRIFKNIKEKIDLIKENLNSKITEKIKRQKLDTDQFLQDLIKNKDWWKEKIGKLLRQEEEKLNLSSPQLKLKQGYTITSDESGKIIKEPAKLKVFQTILTKFYKGQVSSKINKIKK